ncbi:hypothetical protein PsorP6_014443 [Peronosclerospora sorghi]|uniref:Uncharacterized protein n=1 Tax=Peronosclerospora sorghi TaxID=230839 RepID=A0ACC0VFZ7_9STRA|nr:hypothetical protein PsorP6_014443 [Peronosclerospora sorghi]
MMADPGALSESLLKYKGLSIGSTVHDPDNFRQFLKGGFPKAYYVTKPFASLVELWNLALVQEHQQQLKVSLRDEVRFSIAADGSVVLTVLKGVPLEDDDMKNHVFTLESLHRDGTVSSNVATWPTVSSGG